MSTNVKIINNTKAVKEKNLDTPLFLSCNFKNSDSYSIYVVIADCTDGYTENLRRYKTVCMKNGYVQCPEQYNHKSIKGVISAMEKDGFEVTIIEDVTITLN